MQLTQSLAHTIESVYRGFDYEQPLRCRLDLAFPAIYRFNLGSDVDAGCQLPVNQRMRDAPGFFERTATAPCTASRATWRRSSPTAQKSKSLLAAIRASWANLFVPRPPASCPATALHRWSL